MIKEKENIYWLGKNIQDLSKEELIEVIEYLMPLYTENKTKVWELEKENFSLIVDNSLLKL